MKWLPVLAFAAILLGHFAYITRDTLVATGGQWAAFDFDEPERSRLGGYLEQGNYWLGMSYGAAGAFAVWCFGRVLTMRRSALASSTGGLTLSGVLWAGACFLTGCCGSPMLPVYVGLFGPNFLGATRPLTFGITLVSIAVGYVWMSKRSDKVGKNNVNTRLHETAGANPGKV